MADTVQASVIDLVERELEDAKAAYEQIKQQFQGAEQRLIQAQVTRNFLGKLVIPVEGQAPVPATHIIAHGDVPSLVKEQMD